MKLADQGVESAFARTKVGSESGSEHMRMLW